MNINFRIIENIAIEDSHNYFDLHNNFDLKKIEIKPTEIVLFFQKTKEDCGKDELYDVLQISHKNIDSYVIESQSEKKIKKEESTLMSVSFNPKDNLDINIIFLKDNPEMGDEIVYVFEDEFYIRISCDSIALSYFKL